jgi:hypothetical protein
MRGSRHPMPDEPGPRNTLTMRHLLSIHFSTVLDAKGQTKPSLGRPSLQVQKHALKLRLGPQQSEYLSSGVWNVGSGAVDATDSSVSKELVVLGGNDATTDNENFISSGFA